jgi:hypothetical protein
MSAQRWHRRVTRHEISLPIAIDRCQPLSGDVDSRAARAMIGDAKPLCFCVDGLSFAFEAEVHDAVR